MKVGLVALSLGMAVGLGVGCIDEGAPVARAQSHDVADPAPVVTPANVTPFESRQACLAIVGRGERLAREPGRARIGSLNVRWFPRGRSRRPIGDDNDGTDLEWLACLITWLDVDVLAVQEIVQSVEGRRAMRALLERLDALRSPPSDTARFEAYFDDCPDDGRQHVGLIFDRVRVAATELRSLSEINPTGQACGHSLRPAVAAYLRFTTGLDLHLVTVHLDSGTTARDQGNRVKSVASLAALGGGLMEVANDRDLVVLGDFNTMGRARTTSGVSPIDQSTERLTAEAEMESFDERLDAGTIALARVPASHTCTEISGRRASLLDHVYVRRDMEELPADARVEVYGPCRDFSCRASRASTAAYTDAVSDHCPVIVDLMADDRDGRRRR